jgi:hypothetical protein
MRKFTALGSILLMTNASACTAHGNVAQTELGLLCSVEGTKLLNPAMNDEGVCAVFKTKIDSALARQTVTVNSLSEAVPADWIEIDVRFSKPGTASAKLVQYTSGKETAYPEIAVDVMDKAMGPNDVDTLASTVAKALAETPKR